jgi:hypothetical protein
MKIAFHCNQLSIRGTEVAMYDYAQFNESILCNESIVLAKNPKVWPYSDEKAIEKFKTRFKDKVYFYNEINEIENILDDNHVDIFYAQKSGKIDGVISKKRKTVIHAVFQDFEPHGNVYAFISEWLSKVYGGTYPFVPYMVYLPENNEDMREELGIPKHAIVYGRHGGYETFDISYAKAAVMEAAKLRPDIYFLFMNTEKFSDDSYKNIIYLDPVADPYKKVKFINTCNAMIHARNRGETFGLAIAEFSLRNKPVITCAYSSQDSAHYDLLGANGIYYTEQNQLLQLLINPDYLDWDRNWNMYSRYSPAEVMEKFKSVFIDGSKINF